MSNLKFTKHANNYMKCQTNENAVLQHTARDYTKTKKERHGTDGINTARKFKERKKMY